MGEHYRLLGSEYVTKLGDGMHSTYGIGATAPNPTMEITTREGVRVPLGKPVSNPDLLDFAKREVLRKFYLSQATGGAAKPKGRQSKKAQAAAAAAGAAAVAAGKGAAPPSLTNVTPARSSLLYNEYIVYSESQICMRYLLNIRFKYSNRFSSYY